MTMIFPFPPTFSSLLRQKFIVLLALNCLLPVLSVPSNTPERRQTSVSSLNGRRSKQSHPTKYQGTDQEAEGSSSRIVGGQNAMPDRYPYFSILNDGYAFVCGASLIHPDVVLTAAHCLDGDYDELRDLEDLKVEVGAYTQQDDTQRYNKPVYRRVKKFIMHPGYDEYEMSWDFCILILDEPVPERFQPVKLNNNAIYPTEGDQLTVIGVGYRFYDGVSEIYGDLLQEVVLTASSDEFCHAAYEIYGGIEADNMFCAGADGRDICYGDSGGPIVIAGQDSRQDIQVGLASFGATNFCGDILFPSVYAEVSMALDWIHEAICTETSVCSFELCGDSHYNNTHCIHDVDQKESIKPAESSIHNSTSKTNADTNNTESEHTESDAEHETQVGDNQNTTNTSVEKSEGEKKTPDAADGTGGQEMVKNDPAERTKSSSSPMFGNRAVFALSLALLELLL